MNISVKEVLLTPQKLRAHRRPLFMVSASMVGLNGCWMVRSPCGKCLCSANKRNMKKVTGALGALC